MPLEYKALQPTNLTRKIPTIIKRGVYMCDFRVKLIGVKIRAFLQLRQNFIDWKWFTYLSSLGVMTRAQHSRAEQSRAEQSRAEQSRAEQSRAEQSRAD